MRPEIDHCLLCLVLLVACAADQPNATQPKAAPRAPASAPAPETPEPLPLAERLRREGSEHPEARERVERELAQLGQAGVVLTRRRQVLALPLAAQYCATALTGSGLGLSLCAFADGAQAARGRERSRRGFDALIPGRSLLLNENVLLTHTQPASEVARARRRSASGCVSAPRTGRSTPRSEPGAPHGVCARSRFDPRPGAGCPPARATDAYVLRRARPQPTGEKA